jgi:small subunit ribosomal protein S1
LQHEAVKPFMSNPVVPNPSMSNQGSPISDSPEAQSSQASNEGQSFDAILSQFEKSNARKPAESGKGREGTVISVTADSVFFDFGYKTEGVVPLAEFQSRGEAVKAGDKFPVNIKGRDPEGYYELTLGKIVRPTDWPSLQKAFAEKSTIVGRVTGVVKGGLSVDVGVRAFMPASRSGAREAGELEKLVDQEIRCRIIKVDEADEDVVVDRRVIAEEEEKSAKERRYSEVKEGETVSGVVRSLTDYGAFVDIGGVDGLLHVGDISWSRVSKPADVLAVGQQIEARVLKIDPAQRRVSLGMKQLTAHPWDTVPGRFKVGDRVRGAVTRVVDFGAFVELEPGVEGLIHISEMSWAKRVKKASDAVKPGEVVEAVVLGVNPGERRLALGLKQALGDPWADAAQKFAAGTVVEGPITSITKFGAFVQLAEGVEGMIHISDMSAEKRLNHPSDMLKVGQTVTAQVLEVDKEKRRLKLGMKQLVPTGIDEYLVERKVGDEVSGRVIDIANGIARVELGQGIHGTCAIAADSGKKRMDEPSSAGKADLSSLSSMLQARWKSGPPTAETKSVALEAGQVRSFKITKMDPAVKKIELKLA